MKRRIRTDKLVNQMNVVPYIDVMMVLLVIFMITAPMFTPGVINLPSVGKASQITKQPIQITINTIGDYSISQNNKTNKVGDIQSLVNQVLNMSDGETPIVISADKEIKYDNVISVVDKLYTAGIKKVALVVKQKHG